MEHNKEKNTNAQVDFEKVYSTSNYRKASISYGLFMGLIGIVLNTIEPFKACSMCKNPVKLFIDSFYIYMYTMSIVWIIVMSVLLVLAKRQEKVSIKYSTGMRRLSTVQNFERGFPELSRRLSFKKIKSRLFNNQADGIEANDDNDDDDDDDDDENDYTEVQNQDHEKKLPFSHVVVSEDINNNTTNSNVKNEVISSSTLFGVKSLDPLADMSKLNCFIFV